jgi:SAM-dependent methyltransferase
VRCPQLVRRDIRRSFREEALIERAIDAGDGEISGQPDTSERVVEIPWVVSRVRDCRGRVLDIGTAFAPLVYQRLLTRLALEELHTVDLVRTSMPGATSHIADIRNLPFPDEYFDVAICISTLEHIGLNNDQYFGRELSHPDEQGDLAALKEIKRVTRVGGRIFITVPAGRDLTYPTQRQYSPARWTTLVDAVGLRVVDQAFFAHIDNGWVAATETDVANLTYGTGAPYAAAVICAALSPPAASLSRTDVGTRAGS